MLNQFLPIGKLHKELNEFLESWNWILGQINPESNVSLFQDKKTLSKLHHSLNIGRYSSLKFREELIQCAPDEKISEFAKKINVKYSSLSEIQTEKFRQKISNFSWGPNHETKMFVDVFDYPQYLIPQKLEKFNSIEERRKISNPYKQLKEYQSEIYFEAQKYVKNANTRFLIQLPTGAGKTRTAMEIASTFLNKKEGRQVVWLADRSELCEQAIEAFNNAWNHVGKYDLKIIRMWGSDVKLPEKIDGTCFVVGMYQKIHKPLLEGKLKLKGDLIIADEAHNVLAPTHEETIQHLTDVQVKQSRIIGLTATPGRTTSESIQNEQLVAFFNDKIIGIDPIDQGPIEFLQGKTYFGKMHSFTTKNRHKIYSYKR